MAMILAWSVEAKAEPKPSLAILPFVVERGEGPSREARVCPLCKGVSRGGSILAGAEQTVTHLLYQKMEVLGAWEVLPFDVVKGPFFRKGLVPFEEEPLPSAVQLGKELGADFVFLGYLFRFEQRVGSAMGVDRPASVAFHIHLLRVRDGKSIWTGKFDETKRPLSENILKIRSFLRRKASWLTAEELASVGMEEVLEDLPAGKGLEEMR
jgi:hypothetical protein